MEMLQESEVRNMEMSGIAMQPSPVACGTKPQSDPTADIEKLEQQKKGIEQQLKQLEQSKQGTDVIKNAKQKLQKKLKEIDQKIQVLKQQGNAQVQSQADHENPRLPRFDAYVKDDKQPSGAGLYSVERDERGNSLIAFESPNRKRL